MDFYTPIKDIFGSSVSAFFFGFMLGFMLCKMFSFMKFLIKALEKKKTNIWHDTCPCVSHNGKPLAISFKTRNRKTIDVNCPCFNFSNKTCIKSGFICAFYND
ncbi:TPA: hypothetical protein R5723_001880 [Campylobacter jejuni]|nr:hypothetical protein [Campylobacter jejuni]ECL1831095.1 hypothetical protein [Campylobacter jejuni]ECL2361064.1 hypothetical protein [Campylobacter jejuni]ECP8550829.1 hypothetical protein [Campylobacter jejuni]ECP8672158.1 hypothetical protein [Campylobacter jejuni]